MEQKWAMGKHEQLAQKWTKWSLDAAAGKELGKEK